MGFLERAIRRGVSEGIGKAVGQAITKAVEPTATEYGYTVMYCPNEGCGHTYKEKYTDKVTD